jgi:hypothetical protein
MVEDERLEAGCRQDRLADEVQELGEKGRPQPGNAPVEYRVGLS